MSNPNHDSRYNHLLRYQPDSPRPSEPDITHGWRNFGDFGDDDTLRSVLYATAGDSDWFDRQPSAAPSTPRHPRSLTRGNDESLGPEVDRWLALHEDYIPTDDFDDQDQEEDFGAEDYFHFMPRRQSPGYVDLTREATPPLSQERSTLSRLSDSVDRSENNMPSTAKRSRATAASTSSSRTTPETSSGPAQKRPRLNGNSMPQRRSSKGGSSSRSALTTGTQNTNNTNTPDVSEIEHIDLANENKSLAEALQKQREEQVKAQAEPPADAPLRLSNITCVICMDSPKDITATACGHVFCHMCLMEALIAGENRAAYDGPKRSQCPVCRKTLNRTKASDVIPLLLKKGAATQPRRQRQS